jgi:hypothetical protein
LSTWERPAPHPRRLSLRGCFFAMNLFFCHEPALVARTCRPAKLLGFPKLVGTPRCNDARLCRAAGWHSQGAPAPNGLASNKRTIPPGGYLHRLSAKRNGSSFHSITSSARASKVAGTSRPSALAVLRLITSSYLVGACTGRSAGFSPLRMRST